MHPLAGLALAYAAGSIPFAYLAGRARGVDLRKHGSGNLGATNAMRVLGTPAGIAVYLADTLKGMLPVLLLPPRLDTARPELWALALGAAAIAGHVRPVFLMGQGGGKGVATAGGVFFGLAWLPTLIALAGFAVVVALTRYVSAGSLAASTILPISLLAFRGPTDALFLTSCAISAVVIWLHRANIARLARGTEPRLGAGAPRTGAP